MLRRWSRQRFARQPLVALLIASLVFGLLGGTRTFRAQEATPGTPQVSGTPVAGAPCGTVLGLGDESVACINFIHTVADAQVVDIVIDGTTAITEIPFGATSGFVPVPADTYAIAMTAAGDPATVVAELPDQTVEAGVAYEIAAVDLQADGTARFDVWPVDLSPLGQGEARLRVYHAIANGPELDIAHANGGEVLVAALAPLSGTDYLTLPGGSAGLEARSTDDGSTLAPLGTETLVPNTVVSLFLVGTADDPASTTVLPIVIALSGTTPVGTPAATPVATPNA